MHLTFVVTAQRRHQQRIGDFDATPPKIPISLIHRLQSLAACLDEKAFPWQVPFFPFDISGDAQRFGSGTEIDNYAVLFSPNICRIRFLVVGLIFDQSFFGKSTWQTS